MRIILVDMPRESKLSRYQRRPSGDPLVEGMRELGIPLTRKNWLELNFPEGVPDPLPAEVLAEIPWEFEDGEATSARVKR